MQFRKKIPIPLLKTIFRGQFLCPKGSSLKKRGTKRQYWAQSKAFYYLLSLQKKNSQPPLKHSF